MLTWLSENIANIFVLLIVTGIVAAIITAMARSRKNEKSSCGCSCAGCSMSGSCHGGKE